MLYVWALMLVSLSGGAAQPVEVTATDNNEPHLVEILWEAPESCSEHAFRTALAKHLDSESLRSSRVVRARARVDEMTGQWVLALEIVRVDGEAHRDFSGASCMEVVDAAAFVFAIAIDPSIAVLEPTPSPLVPQPIPEVVTPPNDVPTAALPLSELEPQPARSVRVRRRTNAIAPPSVRGLVRASGGIDAIALPGVGSLVSTAIGLLGEYWRVDVGFNYRLPTEAYASRDSTVGGAFTRWAVNARACGVPRVRTVEIPLCGGMSVGQVVATGIGSGIEPRATVKMPWVVPTLTAGVVWPFNRHVGVLLEVDLGIPTIRHRFQVRGLERPIYETLPVNLAVLAGFEARFP